MRVVIQQRHSLRRELTIIASVILCAVITLLVLFLPGVVG
ncbi:hypothetical protein SKPI104516_05615 [Skermania piniformis]